MDYHKLYQKLHSKVVLTAPQDLNGGRRLTEGTKETCQNESGLIHMPSCQPKTRLAPQRHCRGSACRIATHATKIAAKQQALQTTMNAHRLLQACKSRYDWHSTAEQRQISDDLSCHHLRHPSRSCHAFWPACQCAQHSQQYQTFACSHCNSYTESCQKHRAHPSPAKRADILKPNVLYAQYLMRNCSTRQAEPLTKDSCLTWS